MLLVSWFSKQAYLRRAKRPFALLVQVAMATILFWTMPERARATQMRCADTDIVVVAEKTAEQQWACMAVQQTYDFLRLVGIELNGALTIKVSDKPPPNFNHHTIGLFTPKTNEIRILSYESTLSAARINPPLCSIEIDPDLWRSYVTHELGHAAAQQNFAPGVPVFTASEYIAAVIQLATLPKHLLDEILKKYSQLSGFEGKTDITSLYYFLNPCKFAVNAYLHYSKPGNGPSFIQQLLNEGLPE